MTILLSECEDLVSIDFETYWDEQFTLTKYPTHEYILDPRFETQGVALYWPFHNSRQWLTHEEFKVLCRRTDWSRKGIIHHHGHFDAAILAEHYGVNRVEMINGELVTTNPVGLFIDTLPMCRYLIGPRVGASLSAAAKYFGLGRKGDFTLQTKGIRFAQMSREMWMKLGEYAVLDENDDGDAVLTYKLFERIARSFPESEFELMDRVLRMFTQPTMKIDAELLRPYLEYETGRREAIVEELGVEGYVFRSSDKFAALLEPFLAMYGQEVPMKTSPTNGNLIHAFAKSDPGMQALLEHEDEAVRALAETRLIFKSTQAESRVKRLLRMAEVGPARVYLSMYAAHTTRLGGADGLNFQNPEKVKWRKGADGADEMVPNTGMVRRSLEAPDGYTIIVPDASQIEARKNAWFWGESWMTAAFAGGRDIYSEVASMLYGRKIDRKRNVEDYIPGFVGKTCTLGLGFGMGYIRLAHEMLKGALGGPPVQFTEDTLVTLAVDPDEFIDDRFMHDVGAMISRLPMEERIVHCLATAAIVKRYRTRIPKIVDGWKFLNTVVLPAIAEGRTVHFGPGGILHTEKDAIVGPGGLRLFYRDLHRREVRRVDPVTGKEGIQLRWYFLSKRGSIEHTNGTKLCENIIQFLARIVTMGHGCEIARRHPRWWWVMTTHDELPFLVPNAEVAGAEKVMIEIMSTAPAWAEGLPLAAEAGVGRTYGDAK